MNFKGDNKMITVKEYTNIFKDNALKLQRSCEWLVLRPNDSIAFHGAEATDNKRETTEFMLDTPEYKNSSLRKYYYDMKNNPHNFNDFERWKNWGRK